MANQTAHERLDTLRTLAARSLGLTAEHGLRIALDNPELPDIGTVLGILTNDFGPDIVAVHFDLSEDTDNHPRQYVTNALIQAANAAVQNHAGDERYPLLIFTLQDNSGLQFVYGEPIPGQPHRLSSISRLTARWNEQNRTTVERLDQIGKALLAKQPPQNALKDGFDVQPVTEAFFTNYKEAYDHTVSLLTGDLVQAQAEQFVQTLFNRLMFIHFVSKKGWLRFGNNADYLNALWQDYESQATPPQPNFYRDRLASLFFTGLNNPQAQNLPEDDPDTHSRIGNVQYLNGGLFEKTELDLFVETNDIAVPDPAISHLLTDLFYRYNFTIMESTPLDQEVAVDPEMLGKLFEETVNERHKNGAYYTPRPVVAFMCREAIKGYIGSKAIISLSAQAISDLVDRGNADAVTPQQALEIAQAIATVKALDPACGSGAFLLGMLQEIVALNASLFRAGVTPQSLYQQKLDIISNNIYGADKDDLAVSTAMLRLWLTLAVEYEGKTVPTPLPNLDMKLVAGDALTGPNPEQLDFTLQSIMNSSLRQDIIEYTTAQGEQKENLKNSVAATKKELYDSMKDAAPQGAVEWRIDFADVLLEGGFDIVVANPPYIRQEEIKPELYKKSLVNQYSEATTPRSDLYCYFYARALQLLKYGGMHVFVCSNSWLDVGYGAKLQEYLLNNAHVQAIYDSAIERQFSTADINTIITVVSKGLDPNSQDTRFVYLKSEFNSALTNSSLRREVTRSRPNLISTATRANKFIGDKWGGKYLRAPDIYHHILQKCSKKLVRLGDVTKIRRGLTTGANDFFYLTPEELSYWKIEQEFHQPVMTTPQESRSIVVNPAELPKNLFICHLDKDKLAGTNALAYIKQGEKEGFHFGKTMASRPRWYDFGKMSLSYLLINKMIDTTSHAFLIEEGVYANNVLYDISNNKESLLKLCIALNSTACQLFINIEGRTNFGGGMLELAAYELANIQIVNPTLIQEPSPEILTTSSWDILAPSKERYQIDNQVFDALCLTTNERDAVYEEVSTLVNNRKLKAQSK